MVDPASIIPGEARRAVHPLPHSVPTKTQSETTISRSQPPELVPDTSSGDESDEDDEDEDGPLTMAPAEIKVIRRISNRINVLPVIAHGDSLTDEKLEAIKEAVRKEMADAGIDFGVFGPVTKSPGESKGSKRATKFANGAENESTNGHAENGDDATITEASDDEEGAEGRDDDRKSRPVIKLRPAKHRNPSRSRSRRDLSRAADDDRRPFTPDAADSDSVANARFSAHIIAKTDISSLLPFALITPENKKRRKRQKPEPGLDSPATPTVTPGIEAVVQSPTSTEDDHGSHRPETADSVLSPISPASTRTPSVAAKQSFLQGPPADMKGAFLRKFRWGTVDVLDPKHCDFAALRTAILSTHLKILKVHTREVLYEKYRTEKLLARRATQQISEEQRNRLLEDLGI
ncbi:Septin-domain-containing protein, partial [Macrolepiota fuliginosa MF-IS2]